MLREIFKHNLIIGLMLLILSLTPLFYPQNQFYGTVATISYIFYCWGLTLVSDYVAYKNGGLSLLKMIFLHKKSLKTYFIISFVGGFILELYCSYLGGLWWYPYLSNYLYLLIIFVGGFGFYFLSITSTYYAIKIIFDKWRKGTLVVTKPFKYERTLYRVLFILGLIGLTFTFIQIFYNTKLFTIFTFNITTEKTPYIGLGTTIIAFFSLWFIVEFIENKRKRTSFIKDIIHGYLNPLFTIIVTSFIVLLYMELQNLPIGFWIYSSTPLGGIKIFNLPLWIYIGWPLHYIGFVTLYRAFGDEPSEELLAGDKIK